VALLGKPFDPQNFAARMPHCLKGKETPYSLIFTSFPAFPVNLNYSSKFAPAIDTLKIARGIWDFWGQLETVAWCQITTPMR
jgi:hypothetical protein